MKHNRFQSFGVCFALCGLLFSSCTKKQETQVIIAEKPVKEAIQPTQRVGDYEQTLPIDWNGKAYNVIVSRKADESLPLAKDGQQPYFDNRVLVQVVTKDGTVFFAKEFTKSMFASYLDEQTRKDGALLGVVYNRVEGNLLHFAASVGSPDTMSDEYVPFDVVVSTNGSLTIKKAERDDSSGTIAAEEEEGV